jgi:hypothetical protein
MLDNDIWHTHGSGPGHDWIQEDCDARYTVFTPRLHPPVPGREVFHRWRVENWGRINWDDLEEVINLIEADPVRAASFQDGKYGLYDKIEQTWVDELDPAMYSYNKGYKHGRAYQDRDPEEHSAEYLLGYEDGWGDADLDDVSA